MTPLWFFIPFALIGVGLLIWLRYAARQIEVSRKTNTRMYARRSTDAQIVGDQMALREKIHQSAEQAFLSGKTINDCPEEFLLYSHEWAQEFRMAAAELDCEDAPCNI